MNADRRAWCGTTLDVSFRLTCKSAPGKPSRCAARRVVRGRQPEGACGTVTQPRHHTGLWHLQLHRLPDAAARTRPSVDLSAKRLAWFVRSASLAAKPPWRPSPPGPGMGGRAWPKPRAPPKGAPP